MREGSRHGLSAGGLVSESFPCWGSSPRLLASRGVPSTAEPLVSCLWSLPTARCQGWGSEVDSTVRAVSVPLLQAPKRGCQLQWDEGHSPKDVSVWKQMVQPYLE